MMTRGNRRWNDKRLKPETEGTRFVGQRASSIPPRDLTENAHPPAETCQPMTASWLPRDMYGPRRTISGVPAGIRRPDRDVKRLALWQEGTASISLERS